MTTTITTPAVSTTGKYLQNAISTISKFLPQGTKFEETLPVSNIVGKLSEYDSTRAMNITKVLAYSSTFNEAIRNVLTGVEVSDRYRVITSEFDSIRNDLKGQAVLAEKPKLSIFDKLGIYYGTMRRGTIAKRYDNIKHSYTDVSKSMSKQIAYEEGILQGYSEFRLALKSADVESKALLAMMDVNLETAKNNYTAKQSEVDVAFANQSPDATALELQRDELKIIYDKVNKDYQIALDVSTNLTAAYNASEVVFTRVKQVTDVKGQVYQKSVIFFQTNEIVFSGLATAFSAIQGLREGTETLNAMTAGINKGLEDLGSVGNTALKEGIKSGYGVTIEANSIGKLVNAIVQYQEESIGLIEEARNKTKQNAVEIETIVNDGKSRFAKVLEKV